MFGDASLKRMLVSFKNTHCCRRKMTVEERNAQKPFGNLSPGLTGITFFFGSFKRSKNTNGSS